MTTIAFNPGVDATFADVSGTGGISIDTGLMLSAPGLALGTGGVLSLFGNNNGGSVTQTGAISAPTLQIASLNAVTLNNAGNSVGRLFANLTGDLSFTNAGSYVLGNIMAGNVTLNEASAGATISQQFQTSISATSLTLNGNGTTGDTSYQLDNGGGTLSIPSESSRPISARAAATARAR